MRWSFLSEGCLYETQWSSVPQRIPPQSQFSSVYMYPSLKLMTPLTDMHQCVCVCVCVCVCLCVWVRAEPCLCVCVLVYASVQECVSGCIAASLCICVCV